MDKPTALPATDVEPPSSPPMKRWRRTPWRALLVIALVGFVTWRFSHTIDEARFSPFTLEYQERHTVAVFTGDVPLYSTGWRPAPNDVLDHIREKRLVEPAPTDDPRWELVYCVRSYEAGGFKPPWRGLRTKLAQWSAAHPDLAKTLWTVGFGLMRTGGEMESFAACELLGSIGEYCETMEELEASMRRLGAICRIDLMKYRPPRLEVADEGRPKKPMLNLEDKFLFYPVKHPAGDWKPAGLEFEDAFFAAADGVRLHGWYCPCPNPRAVVLHAHGNGGHLAHRDGLMRYYQRRLRVASFIFDYRGYGRSEGKPTVAGILQDARAARSWLAKRTGLKESQLVLTGQSLGGAVAADLAADGGARGLVLESTFSSLKDMAAHYYPQLAVLVPAGKLNSVERLKAYRGPLLMAHGDADNVVPYKFGHALFDAANEPKQWVRIAGGVHNHATTQEFAKALDAFIESLPH